MGIKQQVRLRNIFLSEHLTELCLIQSTIYIKYFSFSNLPENFGAAGMNVGRFSENEYAIRSFRGAYQKYDWLTTRFFTNILVLRRTLNGSPLVQVCMYVQVGKYVYLGNNSTYNFTVVVVRTTTRPHFQYTEFTAVYIKNKHFFN